MKLLSVAFGLFIIGVIYAISAILFLTKWQYYHQTIFPWLHPKLSRDEYPQITKFLIILAAAIIMMANGILLYFNLFYPYPLIFALISTLNEVYRGLIYYPSVGDMKNAYSHMILQSAISMHILDHWLNFERVIAWLIK